MLDSVFKVSIYAVFYAFFSNIKFRDQNVIEISEKKTVSIPSSLVLILTAVVEKSLWRFIKYKIKSFF